MSEQVKLKPIYPIATLLTHLRMISVISVGGTGLIVLSILLFVKPLYRAESGIEVAPIHTRVLHWDAAQNFHSRTQFIDYINTQVSYVVSFENATETLQSIDISETCLEAGNTHRETVENFQAMMDVRWVANTNLIAVAATSRDPTGLDILVNGLVDTYMKRNRELELGMSNARITHLTEEESVKRAEIEEMNRRMAQYTSQLGTLALDELTPQEQSLVYLREAYDIAYVGRLEAENQYLALSKQVLAESELGVESQVEEWVQEDLKTMRNNAYEGIAELNRSAAHLTANHPRLKQLENEVEQDRRILERAVAENRQRARNLLGGKMKQAHKRSLIESRARFEERLKTETELKVRLALEEAAMKDVIPVYINAIQLRREIDRSHVRLTQIEARLEELAIEAREPSRVRVQAEAREPTYPFKNRRRIFAVLALIFCTSTALVLAFAMDFLEPSILTAQHMTQILGCQPTGILVQNDLQDFGSLLRQQPKSYHADLFRRMMPRIFAESYDREHPGIFVILSLGSGAGVTSFALNCLTHLKNIGHAAGFLEVTFSKGSQLERTEGWGLSVEELALPANLDHHYQLDLRTGGGLEFYCIAQGDNEMLANRAHLCELLQHLASRNGILLVEAPPLLQHSETELLCSLADVVVLVVDGPQTAPGELKRGINLLNELGVKKCAIIANKLPVILGGYFARAKASFEGRTLRYPFLTEILTAVKKAIRLPTK